MFYLLHSAKTTKTYCSTQSHPPFQTKNRTFLDQKNDEDDNNTDALFPILEQQQHNDHDANSQQILNIDEALQRLGMGRFQYRIMLATGLFLAADSCEVVILSFLSHVSHSHHWANSSNLHGFSEGDAYETDMTDGGEDTMLSTMVLMGAVVGAVWWGMLGDLFGRRVVILAISTVVSIFGVATSFVTTFEWLLLARILVSFGIGGLTVPFNACAELMPPSVRGKQLVVLQIFWTAGALTAHLLLQQQEQEEIADSSKSWWRLIVGLCAIPSIMATVLSWCFVPESPRWLVAKGNQEIALAILRHGAEINGKDPYFVFPKGIMLYSHEPEEVTGSLSQVMTLFSSGWMSITASLASTYFGKNFLDHGTVSMAVDVFSNDSRQQDYQAWFSSISEFLSLVLVYHIIDRWGRASTQCVAYASGGVVCLTLALLGDYDPAVNPNILLVMAFMAHLFINSATTATWIATTEVLSTAIRTTGHGTAHAIARVAGAFSTYVLAKVYSLPTVGLILFVTSIWTASAASKLPDTHLKEMGVVHSPTAARRSRRRSNGSHKRRTIRVKDGNTLSRQEPYNEVI